MNFLVKVCVHTAGEKQIAQETAGFREERHAQYLATKLPMPGRSPRICGSSAWFQLPAVSRPPSRAGSIWRGDCSRILPKMLRSNLLLPCGEARERATRA